jgi:hypothetical protein
MMRGLNLEQRNAERALYAQVVKMRKKMPVSAIVELLGLNKSRVYDLIGFPPLSEEHLKAIANHDARERKIRKAETAEWREMEKRLRAKQRQEKRDEKHEAKAAAVACLIEAFIELRPYVGTEGIET